MLQKKGKTISLREEHNHKLKGATPNEIHLYNSLINIVINILTKLLLSNKQLGLSQWSCVLFRLPEVTDSFQASTKFYI